MGVDFGLDMKAFVEKFKDRADEVVSKTVLAVGTSLVLKSPVGNPSIWKGNPPKGYVGGRFRANWQYGFNVPKSGVKDKTDATGETSIEDIKEGAKVSGINGVHFIVNNLPYANKLEYGHSTQAPNGMVGLTVVEFQEYVKKAVEESK
jgi:hypothetical protein